MTSHFTETNEGAKSSGTNGNGAEKGGINFKIDANFSDHQSEATHTMSNDNQSGTFMPMAICGMACRLPGGLHSPEQLWSFLLAKGDAKSRIPESRFNVEAYYSPDKKPGTTVSKHGYFLDETVNLAALDTSFFSMARSEVERLDPQQRLLLEVSRECLDDAGQVGWRGSNIGVYVGNYGQDWYDIFNREYQMYGAQVTVNNDFMLANRVSYEMDLRGPR